MEEGQARGGGRVKLLLVTILVVACIGVIAWLAGQLNVHRYYLIRADRELVVHRGAPIPFVTRAFEPKTEAERIAYAPVRIPARWVGPSRESFSDRPAMDRALFAVMQKRLSDEFYSGRLPNLERVDTDMRRVDHLSGLSDEDRRDLEELRGDYAYLKARELIEGLPTRLQEARRLCDLAEQQGTGKLGDPRQLSRRLAMWMQLVANSTVAQPLPPAQVPRPATPLLPELAPKPIVPTPAPSPLPAPAPAPIAPTPETSPLAPGPTPGTPAPEASPATPAPAPAEPVEPAGAGPI